jgi:LPXTG-site transpeptidase (sortase) family protein
MSDQPSKPTTNKEDPAVHLIRSKIDALYGHEPSAKEEIKEVETINQPSKHQAYMKKLGESGKSLAEIQTEWHKYYQALPDTQKHEVWQEFYSANKRAKQPEQKPEHAAKHNNQPPNETRVFHEPNVNAHKPTKNTIAEARKKIHHSVSKNQKAKLSAKAHFKSLLFGLSMGAVMLLVLLFGFFNERFLAPFITPSRNVSSTPIIVDPSSTTAGPESLIIIPKINVEVPVVYDTPTIQEKDIQKGLESGVVHYVTTPNPGEQGNSVVVGHSSNNILNGGKYKFAFVLLNKLENGDTFSMTKGGKRYTYKIYDKKIVKPNDLSVLGKNDKPSTVTLITCDPPGTSLNRLIVVGEQISPDPNTNLASTAQTADSQPTIVPGNAPSLWSRLTGWLFT